MLCDTCTNRLYCENEEKQMCIANDFDRYDDDGSAYSSNPTDPDIDSVRTIFETMVERTAERGSKSLYNTCLAIHTVIDKALGDMLLMNCIHAIEHC